MRSSARRASCRTSRSRTRPTRSSRGLRPSPKGGASRDWRGTGETIVKAQGSPERSAAAAAPHAPSSISRASGCSASIARSRSATWDGARSPNCPSPERSAPNRVRARHPRVRTARSRAQSTRWKGQSNAVGPRPVARSAPRRDALGGPAPPVSARAGTGGPGRRLHTRRQHPSLTGRGRACRRTDQPRLRRSISCWICLSEIGRSP